MKKMSGRMFAQTSTTEWIVSSVPNLSQSPVPQNAIVYYRQEYLVDCRSLLQGILQTDSLPSETPGKHIADRFFAIWATREANILR